LAHFSSGQRLVLHSCVDKYHGGCSLVLPPSCRTGHSTLPYAPPIGFFPVMLDLISLAFRFTAISLMVSRFLVVHSFMFLFSLLSLTVSATISSRFHRFQRVAPHVFILPHRFIRPSLHLCSRFSSTISMGISALVSSRQLKRGRPIEKPSRSSWARHKVREMPWTASVPQAATPAAPYLASLPPWSLVSGFPASAREDEEGKGDHHHSRDPCEGEVGRHNGGLG